MFYGEPIKGRYVDLKSARVEDAEFTRAIRRDPLFSAFFPPLDNTIEEQRAWLCSQHDKPGDYFFVVWDKQGNRIGTNSLYDITGDSGESGRIAIKGNAFQSIEAQLLLFEFAFDMLHLTKVVGYMFADNERAIRFSQQFEGTLFEPEMHDNGHLMVKVTFTKEQVEEAKKKIGRILYR